MANDALRRGTRTLRQAADDCWEAYLRLPPGDARIAMLDRYIGLTAHALKSMPYCTQGKPAPAGWDVVPT